MGIEKISDDELKKELERRGYISLYFSDEDVKLIAEDQGVELSPEELKEVCAELMNIDANIGITNDSIASAISYHLQKKKHSKMKTINYDYSGTLVKDAQELAEECANIASTADEAQEMFNAKCGNATGADTVVFFEEKKQRG